MATLNPTLEGGIAFEQPIPQGPSTGASALGAVTGLMASLKPPTVTEVKPSEKDKEGEALRPFYDKAFRLMDSDLTESDRVRKLDSLSREFLTAYPQYTDSINQFRTDNLGVELNEGDPEAQNRAIRQEWMQSSPIAAGVLMTARAQGYDAQQTMYAVDQAMNEDMARQSRLAILQQDVEAGNLTDELAWEQLTPNWVQQASNKATALVQMVASGDVSVDSPEEAINFMNQMIREQENALRLEAVNVGISSAFVEQHVKEGTAPLVALRDNVLSNNSDVQSTLSTIKGVRERRALESLGGVLGDQVYAPGFLEAFFPSLVSSMQGTDDWKGIVEHWKRKERTGEYNPFVLGTVSPVDPVNAATGNPAVNPDKIVEFKDEAKKDPKFLADELKLAAGMITSDKDEVVTNALQSIALVSEAHEGPIGVESLRQVFSPQSMKAMARAAKTNPEVNSLVTGIIMKQVRHNRAALENAGSVAATYQFRMENGQLVTYVKAKSATAFVTGTENTNQWEKFTGTNSVTKAVEAQNYLLAVSKNFPELKDTVSTAMNYLVRGVEPTAQQVQEGQGIQWGPVDDVNWAQGLGANPLMALMDQKEGGGDYRTLFSHAQKEGREFEGVDITSMTLGQLYEFANPKGPYGQFVAGKNEGTIATPMGRYQFVGTTLRRVAKAMGLPDDTIFNATTQDAMFHYLANETIRGKSRDAARTAIRGVWEGFKNVPDAVLDRAISNFLGLPPPDPTALPRSGTGNPYKEGMSEEPLSIDVPADAFETPSIDAPSIESGDVPTSTEVRTPEGARTSSSSVATAREQVLALLAEFPDLATELISALRGTDGDK